MILWLYIKDTLSYIPTKHKRHLLSFLWVVLNLFYTSALCVILAISLLVLWFAEQPRRVCPLTHQTPISVQHVKKTCLWQMFTNADSCLVGDTSSSLPSMVPNEARWSMLGLVCNRLYSFIVLRKWLQVFGSVIEKWGCKCFLKSLLARLDSFLAFFFFESFLGDSLPSGISYYHIACQGYWDTCVSTKSESNNTITSIIVI